MRRKREECCRTGSNISPTTSKLHSEAAATFSVAASSTNALTAPDLTIATIASWSLSVSQDFPTAITPYLESKQEGRRGQLCEAMPRTIGSTSQKWHTCRPGRYCNLPT